jgi:hypothetical protein
VGLANFFRNLIPRFSAHSSFLTELTKKTSDWCEGTLPPTAQRAFEHLRDALVNAPVVAYPDPKKPFHVYVDAATGDEEFRGGMGACLMQLSTDGELQAVAYASRSLKKAELNYTPYLLELQACVWAIEHYTHHLRGVHFYLHTDHKPLEKLGRIHVKTLNRLKEIMLEYDFDIRFKPGTQNGAADYLSRNASHKHQLAEDIVASINLSMTNIKELQDGDPTIASWKSFREVREDHGNLLADGTRKWIFGNTIVDRNGILRRITNNGAHPTIVPRAVGKELITMIHNSWIGGHEGQQKTFKRVIKDFWWADIKADTLTHTRACKACQHSKQGPRVPKPDLQPLAQCTGPNIRVHIDLYGPLKTSSEGKKMIMVMTDAFSKVSEITAITDKTANTVAKAFTDKWICRYGVPAIVVSDQGREFNNSLFNTLSETLGFEHRFTNPYHPQSNAQAETFNRTIRRYLTTALEGNTLDWEPLLPALMFSYNTSVHQAI